MIGKESLAQNVSRAICTSSTRLPVPSFLAVCLSVCLCLFYDRDLEIQGETETKTERLVSAFISRRCYLISCVKINDHFQTQVIFYQNILDYRNIKVLLLEA